MTETVNKVLYLTSYLYEDGDESTKSLFSAPEERERRHARVSNNAHVTIIRLGIDIK